LFVVYGGMIQSCRELSQLQARDCRLVRDFIATSHQDPSKKAEEKRREGEIEAVRAVLSGLFLAGRCECRSTSL
jgi:hypothetical protein